MVLHKSLSEHGGNSKRSKSHGNNAAATTPSTEKPSDVTPTTKAKLSKFQFQSTTTDVDTENTALTPVTRLNWRDLVEPSGAPDAIDGLGESPNDRITWDQSRIPAFSAIVSPSLALGRTGCKRARSSSPMSSPAREGMNTPCVSSIKRLAQAARTPHADPTLELWDRFSVADSTKATTRKQGAGESLSGPAAVNPALAQFMVSSSPRPGKEGLLFNGGSPGGLRRSMSCGGGLWPPKRRRINRYDSMPAQMEAMHETEADASSKTSLVTELLDTVASSLRAQEQRKSSSEESPVLGRNIPRLEEMSSPSPPTRKVPSKGSPSRNHKRVASHRGAALSPLPEAAEVAVPIAAPASAVSLVFDLGSDDFGDDDFDDDTLMELEATMTKLSQKPLASPAQPVGNPAKEPAAAESSLPTQPQVGVYVDPDDFDDFGDDIFDDDAAGELLTTMEQQPGFGTQAVPSAPTKFQAPEPARRPATTTLEDAFDDDFGQDVDFDAVELAGTQSLARKTAMPTSQKHKPRAIQRYLVTQVLESEYESSRSQRLEKILMVKADDSKVFRTIHLRDDWFETPVHTKSYVHVIGEFVANSCVIDDTQNILILHPDQLISATVIADSFTCTRRAVLQDRVKATSEPSSALIYGTMLHEIFQAALMENRWDRMFLASTIDKIVEDHIEELFSIKIGMHVAKEHLHTKMPELTQWAHAFVGAEPRADAVVHDRGGKKINMSLTKLLDVEEHVWSPMYGLKGSIDATVQVRLQDGPDKRVLTVPLEVKTGNGRYVSSNHTAQTSLYNLLLSDRYDIEIAFGVLYYMESGSTHRIPAIHHELRHMIMQRNRLAVDVMERSVQLPPMKRSKNMCGGCYAKTTCFLYHKLADNGNGETSGMGGKFDEVVGHLTETHREFFVKWENLLTKEEKESMKFRRELWTMVSAEREKKGRCFADIVIAPTSAGGVHANGGVAASKINRFSYTFTKGNPPPGFSFVESQITLGEPIVVSDEQGHFALALGYVTSVHRSHISVSVDRRLHNARTRQPGFDARDNQVFASIMDVSRQGPQATQVYQNEEPIRYRLDKDEFSNGMATVRNNLVQITSDTVLGARQIRSLIVDLKPPRFRATKQPSLEDMGAHSSLNVDQKRAIAKVMSAQDYALVLGMPGTGKTTTIAHIIRALVSQGKSVLLTSYTHTAVDNILLKLKGNDLGILRLGAVSKIHPDVQQFATVASQQRFRSFDEIKTAWLDTPIVATTCLGINHALFSERTFDYCIVDEASQITLPICLGPIRLSRTFVLVGDHNQLPPLVRNEEAREGGLDVSLFKLLSDVHPDSVVNLEHQYRMCEDIMTLSNTLIYNGRLQCGYEALKQHMLDVPDLDALCKMHHPVPLEGHTSTCPSASSPSCWLQTLISPTTRVAFVNTDTLMPKPQEEAKGNLIINPAEASIVAQLVEGLLCCGVTHQGIGVMTHYRSQLALLRHILRSEQKRGLELDTADRFQGRDKEVIVLSLVRSNDGCAIGELLRDWRRINVAFTRAKTKLLVVGSRETLKGCGDGEILSKFVALMEERAWVFDLPGNGLSGHISLVEGATQTSIGTQVKSSGMVLLGSSPAKRRVWEVAGKENEAPAREGPKKARISDRVVRREVGSMPVLRDIMNEMIDGGF